MLNSSLNCRINLTAIPVLNWDGGEKIARVINADLFSRVFSIIVLFLARFSLHYISLLKDVLKTIQKLIYVDKRLHYKNIDSRQSTVEIFNRRELGKYNNIFPLQTIFIL